MTIKTVQFGVHKDVTHATFGSGDIMMTAASDQPGGSENMLVFSLFDIPRKIGEVEPGWLGKPTDEIPNVKIVFQFTDTHSITALVQSLLEVQDQMFKKIAR